MGTDAKHKVHIPDSAIKEFRANLDRDAKHKVDIPDFVIEETLADIERYMLVWERQLRRAYHDMQEREQDENRSVSEPFAVNFDDENLEGDDELDPPHLIVWRQRAEPEPTR